MRIKLLIILLLAVELIGCGKSRDPHYQGYVEGENIFLASPYSGVLVERAVSRGQWVKKGDLIFRLEANPEALLVKQSEAELLQAKKIYKDLENPRRDPEIAAIKAQIEQMNAQLRLAELRVKRTSQLFAKNAGDKDEMDAAQSHFEEVQHMKEQYQANLDLALRGGREEQLNAQQAQINALIAKLNQAKWQLAQKNGYAPDNGVIFDTYYIEGEFVGNQQAVASLLTPDNIRIEFYVPADALSDLSVGEKIMFNCDGCAQDNQASISYISPRAEYIPPLVYSRDNTDKLVFRVKAAIAHPSQFKPGQPVTVSGFNHG